MTGFEADVVACPCSDAWRINPGREKCDEGRSLSEGPTGGRGWETSRSKLGKAREQGRARGGASRMATQSAYPFRRESADNV